MPRFLTFADSVRINGEIQLSERRKTASLSRPASTNTFLSHSHKDNSLVPVVKEVLENHGGNVWVDIGAEQMPNPPSTATAAILRKRIRENRKFVLLVSTNSKTSKWIPWELGMADGQKSPNAEITPRDVALFPVSEGSYDHNWAEQEYFGLYRRIVWGEMVGHKGEVWMVWDHHSNTATELSEWYRQY